MANIELSIAESELICNKEILLLKASAMQKMRDFFGLLSEDYRQILETYRHQVPPIWHQLSPKVSRGENLARLPFVILDYPRFFTRENIFSIRSFFWWGNFFSITLHLKGQYKINFQEKIFHSSLNTGWYFQTGHAEWDHSFNKKNYKAGKSLLRDHALVRSLMQQPFLKVTRGIGLEEWHRAPGFYRKNFRQLCQMLYD